MRIKLFLSTILIFTLCVSACKKEEDTMQKKESATIVKTMTLTQQSSQSQRQFPGVVEAGENVKMSFQVDGRIEKLPVDEGQKIKKGQLISQLQQGDYKDALKKATAQREYRESQLARATPLVKDGYIARADFDKIQSDYDVAVADENTAKRNLEYTTLYAPFNGIITKKYVKVHQYIRPKQEIAHLQDVSDVKVKVDVPENIILNVREGKHSSTPRVIFPGSPNKSFDADFFEISTEADPDTQTYDVVFILPQPKDINVYPGMTAVVKVMLPDFKSENQSYFVIPSSAVFNDSNNETTVWVIDSNQRLKRTQVTVSRVTGDKIRVLSGLQSGQTIVTAGVHFLKEGQLVKPTE
ncbi:MAG: efflux RND transporter periplasmic adaptor subunit [Gammaproteobacteria bacterium]